MEISPEECDEKLGKRGKMSRITLCPLGHFVSPPGKQETQKQCWFIVGRQSATLAQQ